MSLEGLREQFDAIGQYQKLIVAALAVLGEPTGAKRLHEFLVLSGVRDDEEQLAADLNHLRIRGMVEQAIGRGYTAASGVVWPALRYARPAAAAVCT